MDKDGEKMMLIIGFVKVIDCGDKKIIVNVVVFGVIKMDMYVVVVCEYIFGGENFIDE